MVHTTLGPDEQIYLAHAGAVRAGGITALRDLGSEYVDEPTLHQYPSPLRWLWAALVALTLPIGDTTLQIGSAALLGPAALYFTHSWQAAVWAATSPLVFTLCRKRLQDVPMALGTLAAIGSASLHNPIGTAVAIAVCLCMKESAILALPAVAAAWLVAGGAVAPMLIAIGAGAGVWALSLVLIFRRSLPAMFRTAVAGHETPYAKQHQRGAPHRLLVDLAMASPAAVLMAVLGAAHSPALASALVVLLAMHAVAPIRNVRFVLAADVLLRIIGASAMAHPFIELPIVLGVDAYIGWRIRKVYDPVTRALATALGMPAQ